MNCILLMEDKMTNKRHKHADLIHAWAEGAIIQFEDSPGEWLDCADNDPQWAEGTNYRIKPTKKVVRFRNWLMKSGDIVTYVEGKDSDPSDLHKVFVRWLGDWQQIELEE